MPYILIEDFKYGIDRRRPRFAGIPGTLWDAVNCHLSRGGDLERCKTFAEVFSGLDDTFGLGAIGGQMYVFGSSDLAGSMPNGVQYQRLQSPGGSDMTRVLDVKTFDNKFYVIADFADGSRHHFYNGTRVAHWDTVADAIATPLLTYRALAIEVALSSAVNAEPVEDGVLISARVPGTPYTISASATNVGGTDDQTATVTALAANVAASDSVEATAQISVTGGSFDPGVNRIADIRVQSPGGAITSILPGPVDWITSDDTTALAVSVAINESTDVHGHSASVAGSTLTITAPDGAGTGQNGYQLFGVVEGNATVTAADTFAGGVDAVAAVTQRSKVAFGGTFDTDDILTITIDSVDYSITARTAATGTVAYVQDRRVWSIAGPSLVYCKFGDPSDWTDATATTGAGQLVVSTDTEGAQILTGIAPYQGFAAIFAENAIVVYALGADPANFERVQQVPNSGTLAGRAVIGYGANDVFYLAQTGVRSLQARDSSNAAFVSDAGTAFDPFVQNLIASLSPRAVNDALSIIEPSTGAYWLAIGSNILVLTNYPGTKIRGWTRYSPGFEVTGVLSVRGVVYLRSSDTIYAYGGTTGLTYPGENEFPVTVDLPFFTARDEAGVKQFTGIDIGGENLWSLTAYVNPKDESETIDLGKLDGVTYADENADAIGETSHLALRLTCTAAGRASLSNMALHHNGKARG